jgi:hypothetical protein
MKRLLLALSLTLALPVCGLWAADEPNLEPSRAIESGELHPLPGIALAEGISEITGVAISPLLGVSAVGAWQYYRTPGNFRDRLPWYCHPAVWGVGFGLLVLCFLKDTLGTATPTLLKKPLDLVELFENKFSALITSAAVVPIIASQMAQAFSDRPHGSSFVAPDAGFASALPVALGFVDPRLFFIPLSLLAFFAVWVTSHAVNVLIVLSPFGLLDALLKLMKTSVLATVAASTLLNPFVGAAISLLIIFIALWLAPGAIRFAVFGTLIASDLLLPWRAKSRIDLAEPHVFTARRLGGVPARTFGRIVRLPDAFAFSYRPWGVLPRQTVALPSESITIDRGILFPTLMQPCGPQSRLTPILDYLPRYRGSEDRIAEQLRATAVRPHAFARGFGAVKTWLTELFGSTTVGCDDLDRRIALQKS